MAPVQTSETLSKVTQALENRQNSISERFRALFTLRNLGGNEAIDSISRCFDDDSVLLKHELAYCLGQMQDSYAVKTLMEVLEDEKQEPIVRHEAGEALGAIGNETALEVIKKHSTNPVREISETCKLALERIEWMKGGGGMTGDSEEGKEKGEIVYMSVDPAPPSGIKDIQQLCENLLHEELGLFDRYRAMFALRNIGGAEAVAGLVKGLKCDGALFKHEVAYVLGQMQDAGATEGLIDRLTDQTESAMVRHECAEALGSIASEKCVDVLKEYYKDKEMVVSQSCEIALDMADYEKSQEQFEYADALSKQQIERKVV